MEVIGILKEKFDTQKVSDRFTKREFVLSTETNTPYPQHVSFQLTQDKCSLLDGVIEGTELKVQFNLRGREWNGPQGIKYFNTLEAWRVEKTGVVIAPNTDQPQQSVQNAEVPPANPPVFTGNAGANDDLPF